MTYDRKDFTDYVNGSGKKQQPRENLAYIAQAGVKASLLTGSPHWDTFLTYVQAAIEASRGQLVQLEAKLTDPMFLDPAELMRIKMLAAICRTRIQAWEAVLSLPKDLMAEGDKARDILARIQDAEPTS